MSGPVDAVQRTTQAPGKPRGNPTLYPLPDGFYDDPYQHFTVLREESPVHVDDRGVVFCFSYEDSRRLFRDPKSTAMDRVRATVAAGGDGSRAAAPTFPLGVINQDPPDHTRIRRLLSAAFTPRAVDKVVRSMSGSVERLLDDLDHQARDADGPVDLVAGLAFSFPFRVISAMLGMPPGRDEAVRTWSHAIAVASDPVVPRDQLAGAIAAYREMGDYIATEVLPWKRQHTDDDLLSLLLAAEHDGTLSTTELVDNVSLLFTAGHETTTGLIANGVLNLLRNRGQLERLRADLSLLPNGIEELNRFEGSTQLGWRYALEDLTVRDTVVPAGSMLFLGIASANRDPDHFGETADTLDVGRGNAKDAISFGAGIHFCIGAPLARREAALVIGRLLQRFPALELAGAPVWNRTVTMRSVGMLPVTLH